VPSPLDEKLPNDLFMIPSVTEVGAVPTPQDVILQDVFGMPRIEIGENLERLLAVPKVVGEIIGYGHASASGRHVDSPDAGNQSESDVPDIIPVVGQRVPEHAILG
jgi:hypothetical protein